MQKLLIILLGIGLLSCGPRSDINIVTGEISPEAMGKTLSHEHILVDFIGADSAGKHRYNAKDVIQTALPHLKALHQLGYSTLVECTPAYLGRDVELLRTLSEQSGLQILTNTGYYGARENKFLPDHAFTESDSTLSKRWINEFKNGIDDTNIKPGFIKISVDRGAPLSDMHQKLVRAAAITHKATGLTIMSHTGTYETAVPQLTILKSMGIHPSAFIWTHAHAEKDYDNIVEAAQQGAWVAFDGFREKRIDHFTKCLKILKENALLNHILISHDAGWYEPGDPDRQYRGYGDIENHLIPELREEGFSQEEIDLMMIKNPAEAFAIRVRAL